MEDESYLDALGRTGPRYVAGQGEGDELADAILRDPLTPVGFGVGAAIKGLRPILGLGADLGTNAAGMAADQYATTGTVNGGEIGAGAGMGALLGLGGMARGGKRSMISPEERDANFRNWFGESKVVDADGKPKIIYSGQPKGRSEFHGVDRSEIGGVGFFTEDKGVADLYAGIAESEKDGVTGFSSGRDGEVGEYYLGILNPWLPDDVNDKQLGKWIQAAARDELGDSYTSRSPKERAEAGWDYFLNKYGYPEMVSEGDVTFSEWKESHDLSDLISEKISDDVLSAGFTSGAIAKTKHGALIIKEPHLFDDIKNKFSYDGIIYPDPEHDRAITYVPFSPTQIKSATGNRGTFDPNDPNITHFAGSASAPSRNRATTRIERQAAQVAYDKYGRPREESAGRPVSTFQGLGSLLSSPSDTYYTRGGR
jgi:hypothetical protein